MIIKNTHAIIERKFSLMRRNVIFFLGIFFTVCLISGCTFYFFSDEILHFFTPKELPVPGGAIEVQRQPSTCKAGDTACEAKNEQIMAGNIDGKAATFARNQCTGLRFCPTPLPDQTDITIAAIRSYLKEPDVKLIRMTGITSAGMIYYCTEDGRCFTYNTKLKTVTPIMEGANTEASITPSISPTSTKSKKL